jgi:hypothetical protein
MVVRVLLILFLVGAVVVVGAVVSGVGKVERAAPAAVAPPNPTITPATPTVLPSPAPTATPPQAEDVLRVLATPGPFTIEMSDQELTALIAQATAESKDSVVSNVQVQFQEGAFLLTGTVTQPLRATLRVRGRLMPIDGQVRVAIDEAMLSSLPMPDALQARLAEHVNEQLDEFTHQLNVHVSDVQLSPGRVRITGVRR